MSRMAASLPTLPHDLATCHDLIRQLQADSQHAATQLADAELQVCEAQARVAHQEALETEYRETIASYEETIEKLTADNKLLKRYIFGSRRERYADDPNQIPLFDWKSLISGEQDETAKESPETGASAKKKRTSRGRQRRVFPEFIPREEERYLLDETDIPEEMLNDPNARRFFKKIGDQVTIELAERLEYVERTRDGRLVSWYWWSLPPPSGRIRRGDASPASLLHAVPRSILLRRCQDAPDATLTHHIPVHRRSHCSH